MRRRPRYLKFPPSAPPDSGRRIPVFADEPKNRPDDAVVWRVGTGGIAKLAACTGRQARRRMGLELSGVLLCTLPRQSQVGTVDDLDVAGGEGRGRRSPCVAGQGGRRAGVIRAAFSRQVHPPISRVGTVLSLRFAACLVFF